MSQRETIARYSLIINKLRKTPSNYQEIAEYLKQESEIQSYNFNISKRTLQRDIQDIYSLYNIEIKFDYTQKVYGIKFNNEPEIGERIMEAFDTFNALNISDRVSGFVHLEKRHPAGTDNLYGLLHAIRNKVRIKFEYHKFWDDKSSFRIAEPYALKEFKHRWYVLANDVNDNKVKSFALDRLSNLEITKAGFEIPTSFNLEENYRYCFGIISPENESPAEIILAFDAIQGKYVKTMPLHESQKVIFESDTELRISLKLFVTHDLMMELLSFGSSMKVLQPQTLAKEIKEELKRALSKY